MKNLESPYPYLWLKEHANITPNQIIVYYQDNTGTERTVTYSAFFDKVEELARQLKDEPPQTIFSVCSNQPLDYLVGMMAAFKLQLIYLPFASNFNNPKPEAIEQHLLLAKQFFKKPGYIYTSNPDFLPPFLRNYLFLPKKSFGSFQPSELTYSTNLPAYICCSSGTTSHPKLILNNFEGLHLRVKDHAEQLFDSSLNQSLLGFSGFDFDASVLDFLMVLFKGKSINIVHDRVKQSIFTELPELFKNAARNGHPITAGVLLPKILKGVLGKGLDPNDFPGLRRLVTMGDDCKIPWLLPFLNSGVKVYNGYGHTETAIASLIAPISRTDTYLPLGKPLEGAIIYLVDTSKGDDNLEVVATITKATTTQHMRTLSESLKDNVFELFHGGIGVGRYLHEDNKEAFLTKPEKDWPFTDSLRVYRSGDLVKMRDEHLVFHDRIKLFKRNGIRVFLNDIEEKFRHLPEIEKFFVQPLEDFIVAYVKLNHDISITVRDNLISTLHNIRNELEPQLRPDFFLELDQLTYTDRHKLNTKTVDSSQCRLLHKSNTKPCQTVLEKELAKLFAKLLLPNNIKGIEETIQRDTLFTALGGDSIKISSLTTLIWKDILHKNPKLGIPFDFANYIYRNTRLADIATYIETYQHNAKKHYKLAESYLPIFYVSNLDSPQEFLLTEPIKAEIIQLVPKQFESEKVSSETLDNSWESMLEQCIRAIYGYQQLGPYILLTNTSDLAFTQQIAAQLAQTDAVIHLICYDNKDRIANDLILSLKNWVSKKPASSSTGVYQKHSQDSAILVTLLNETYDEVCNNQFNYKIDKYFKTINEQFSLSSALTPKDTEILDKLKQYAQDMNAAPIFLSGPAGSGKKTLCLLLFKYLKEKYDTNSSNILPLVIDARNSSGTNLCTLLETKGFNAKDIELLLTKSVFFLILNFDETLRHDFPNYYESYNKSSNVKMLVCVREHVSPSLLLQQWNKTSTRRLELGEVTKGFEHALELVRRYKLAIPLQPSTLSVLQTLSLPSQCTTNTIYEQFLIHWLRKEAQKSAHPRGINLESFLDCVIHFPYNITFKPRPSLWEPDCTPEDRLFKRLSNDINFSLLKSLLLKDKKNPNIFYCPIWLKALAVKNKDEQNDVAAFTSLEIELQKVAGPLTKLLSPEELQTVIATEPSFVPLNTGQQQAPIFFFHPLTGATPTEYRILAKMLGPTQAAFNFVIHFSNDSSSLNFEKRCQYFAKLIEKIQPTGVIHLVGWSFGGILAFGVASVLERTRTLGLVMNIDCSSPAAIKNFPPGARAIDLIATLPKLFRLESELDIKKECLDLKIQASQEDLDTTQINELLDTIFNKALQFYKEKSKLDSVKKNQLMIALQNSCVNLKAGYDSINHSLFLNNTTLQLIVTGHTRGINLNNDKLASYLWQNYLQDPRLLKTHPFYDSNHFNIFENKKFLSLFRQLVSEQQALVQTLTIKRRIKRYIKKFKKDPLYIDLEAQDAEIGTKRYDILQKKLPDFLKGTSKFLCLVGEAGAGKTTFLHNLMALQALLRKTSFVERLILYVKVNDQAVSNIEQALRSNHFTDIEIQNELKLRPILFLLDGMGKNLARQLIEVCNEWPNAKFLITLRKEKLLQLKSDSLYQFVECYLSTYSQEQINSYLEKSERHFSTNISFNDLSNRHPEIKKLSTNPLILKILLDIIKQTGTFNLPYLNRSNIYDTYRKINYQRALDQITRSCGIPPGTNFEIACDQYAQKVAVELFSSEFVPVDYQQFLDNNLDTQLVRTGIGLTQHEGKPQFAHETYAEYYFARQLLQDLRDEKYELWQIISFTRNPSLLNFVAQMLNNLPNHLRDLEIAKLFALIKVTCNSDNEEDITAAANAITVLNYARVSFSGRELSRSKIRRADLSNSMNDSTTYYKSDLEDVLFQNAWMRNADIRECKLKGTVFAYPSPIHEKGKIKNIVISPRGTYLAITFSNQSKLKVYNLKTQNIVMIFSDATKPISHVSFHREEEWLLLADEGGTFYKTNLFSTQYNPFKRDSVSEICFASSGSEFYTSHSGILVRINFSDMEMLNIFEGQVRFVWEVSNSGFILVGTTDKNLKMLSLTNKIGENSFGACNTEIFALKNKNEITFSAHVEMNNVIALKIIVPNELSLSPKNLIKAYAQDFSSSLKSLDQTSAFEKLYRSYALIQQMNTMLGAFLAEEAHAEHLGTEFSALEYRLKDDADVTHLLFHPNGEILFSVNKNNSVSVWDLTKKVINTRLVLHSTITSLAVTSTGGLIAIGCDNGVIKIWETANWQLVNTLQGHVSAIIKLAYHHEDLLISCDQNSTVRFWDMSTVRSTLSIGHSTEIDTITRGKNEDEIISMSTDGIVTQWQLSTGQILATNQLPNSSKYLLSPQGRYLAYYQPNSLELWNIFDNRLSTIELLNDNNKVLLFDSEEKTLFVAIGQEILMLDLLSLTQQTINLDITTPIEELHLSCSNSVLIAVCKQRKLYVYNLMARQKLDFTLSNVNTICALPQSSFLALICNKTVNVYKTPSMQLVFSKKYWTKNIQIKLSLDSCLLAVHINNLFDIWDIQKNQCIRHICEERVQDFSWKNGETLIIVSQNALVYWNKNSKCLPQTINLFIHYKKVFFINDYIIATGKSGELLTWHINKTHILPKWQLFWQSHSVCFTASCMNFSGAEGVDKPTSDILTIAGASEHLPLGPLYLKLFKTDCSPEDFSAADLSLVNQVCGFYKRSLVDEAIRLYRLDIVRKLIKAGANLNHVNSQGLSALNWAATIADPNMTKLVLDNNIQHGITNQVESPLNTAVECGNLEVIDAFLSKDDSYLNARPYPLVRAIKQNQFEAAELLLKRKANPSVYDDNGPPLHVAVSIGNPEMITLLINHGADVEARFKEEDIEDINLKQTMALSAKNNSTPLHHAAEHNQIEAMLILITREAQVNTVTKLGWTPLHFAATVDDPLAIRILLEKGAIKSLEKQTSENKTPLAIAIENGHEQAARELLSHGANPNFSYDNVPILFRAVDKKQTKLVKLLLEFKAHVVIQLLDRGITLLRLAIEKDLEIFSLVLKSITDINFFRNTTSPTILYAACNGKLNELKLINSKLHISHFRNTAIAMNGAVVYSHPEVVEFFLAQGNDPDAIDDDGEEALHYAVNFGRVECARLLAPLTKNINKYYAKCTLFHLAMHRRREQIADILLQNGADPTLPLDTPDKIHVLFSLVSFDNLQMITYIYNRYPEQIHCLSNTGFNLLHWATTQYRLEIVRFLVDKIDIEKDSITYGRPLHAAALSNNADAIHVLIKAGAKLESQDDEKQTPLNLAIAQDNFESVLVLLDLGANIETELEPGATPLMQSIRCKDPRISKLLIERKANVHVCLHSHNVLLTAVAFGKTDLVQQLLSAGARYDSVNDEGNNAFFMVSGALNRQQLDDIFIIFISAGLSLQQKNIHGNTIYHHAAANDIKNILNYLQDYELNLNETNNHGTKICDLLSLVISLQERAKARLPENIYNLCKPIHLAAFLGEIETSKILLAAGAKPCRISVTKSYPLHIAIAKQHFSLALEYIALSININDKDADNRTALHTAAREGRLDIVIALIEKGANLHLRSNHNFVIHDAAASGNLELVRYLHAKGADLDAKDGEDDTPLEWASERDEVGIPMMQLLLERGAKIDAQNVRGETTLYLCVKHKRMAAITFLANNGADPSKEAIDGKSPLDLALELQLTSAIELFTTQLSAPPIIETAPPSYPAFFSTTNIALPPQAPDSPSTESKPYEFKS